MKRLAFLCSILFIVISCTKKEESLTPSYGTVAVASKPVIHFAIHPLHNPEMLNQVFGPMISYLNKNIQDYAFQLEASVNYAAFEEKIKARQIEFALPNPYQTLLALKYGYRVFGKMGDDENFKGIVIVRKDSGFKNISDLKGKSISYPAPTALAATMMPQYFLYKNGLNIIKETKSLYVGSQESSIMSVFLKTSQAGCTWPPPWNAFIKNNPDKAKELEVKWQTTTLPNNSLVVRDNVPLVLADKVQALLVHLHESDEGKKILNDIGLSNFEIANEATYDSVKTFIQKFTKELRSPEKEM